MAGIEKDYIKRLYAGWYGKLIGVRYGAPTESWSYEKIQKVFGELDGYVVDYKDFAADDDSNGPMFFLRALEDYGLDVTAEQLGLTWLNYVAEGKGFFWWGGYGISTENTAYLNLLSGIPAPRSGSIGQNGAAVAEQIGGQIFIDTWGLITPGNPDLAAEYARKAASVSHDGNGIYGGIFVACAVSHAFVERDIYKVIEKALSYIPKDSEYIRMAGDIIRFYEDNRDNWRSCFRFIQENYGYDRYPGVCHIIPNSAVMLLSLLYGEGDFDKTINICNMCGWDTDCNVGNVGCILGVLVGLEGINYQKWIKPINDFFCCSSVIGSLNIMDVPWCVQYIGNLAYRIAGENPPGEWEKFLSFDTPKFHFDLPESTHGFRVRYSENRKQEYCLRQTDERAWEGQGSLVFTANRVLNGDDIYLYHKTFYHPSDLHDSRYDPSFSPILYPGETISCKVSVPKALAGKLKVSLYVKDDNSGRIMKSEAKLISSADWLSLEYVIPGEDGMLIGEAGIIATICAKEDFYSVQLYLDSFDFSGCADYAVDFFREKIEKWHAVRSTVGQFTTNKGIWELEDGYLSGRCYDHGSCLTGRYDFKDYNFSATMTPKSGGSHFIIFRVQGLIRSYGLALLEGNRLALLKNANGWQELAVLDYNWELGHSYSFRVELTGANIAVYQDQAKLLDYTDLQQPYLRGQVGAMVRSGSHCLYRDFRMKIKK